MIASGGGGNVFVAHLLAAMAVIVTTKTGAQKGPPLKARTVLRYSSTSMCHLLLVARMKAILLLNGGAPSSGDNKNDPTRYGMSRSKIYLSPTILIV